MRRQCGLWSLRRVLLIREYDKACSSSMMPCACVQRSGKDALARRLGQTAASKLRQRAATARRKAPLPTPGSMPPPGSTPARRGHPASVTPARPQLSHAGKKLAQTLHGK